MLTRRRALALGAAALATPALSSDPIKVLFIGNSFTFEHDLPLMFADIARQGGHNVQVDMIAEGGAHLADTFRTQSPDHVVATYDPDLIILQDFSTVALVPEFSEDSHKALRSFCRFPSIRKILFATWPRAEGHKLYRETGMPRTPREMNDLVHAHYRAARCPSPRERTNHIIAPVGDAWMLGPGLPLHRNDKYHASLTGAWLTALVLARTAELAPETPASPQGVKLANRLIQIARTLVP